MVGEAYVSSSGHMLARPPLAEKLPALAGSATLAATPGRVSSLGPASPSRWTSAVLAFTAQFTIHISGVLECCPQTSIAQSKIARMIEIIGSETLVCMYANQDSSRPQTAPAHASLALQENSQMHMHQQAALPAPR